MYGIPRVLPVVDLPPVAAELDLDKPRAIGALKLGERACEVEPVRT